MKLDHHEIVSLLILLSVLLLMARLMGELARKLNFPVVVGEILAGVVLGPSLLGMVAPEWYAAFYADTGQMPLAFDGFRTIAVVLLLFVAGLEIELPLLWHYGRASMKISLLGMTIPFLIGFGAAYYFPDFFEDYRRSDLLTFSLFLGTGMAITALPVIAKIMMDLNMLKTRLGITIITSAMIDDLLGWILFSIILSMLGRSGESHSITYTLGLTVGFVLFMLSFGKRIFDAILPWINKHFAWPGGFLSITICLGLLGAAFTEYLGIHAVFGAFIVGIAMGDTSNLTEKAKEIIHQFVNNFFAPLFFASVGLKVNFIANFDLTLTLVIIALAFVGKLLGCVTGARISKFSLNDSLIIGFGMNARGAMEIILATLALQNGLIDEKMFVSLVIMAFVTSLTSGPVMRKLFKPEVSAKESLSKGA